MEQRPLINVAEEELVELARQRDQGAFAELALRHTPMSFRLALSVLKDREEAHDQVQNSLMSAWKHVVTFQGDSRFSTWLRTIVMNQSLMRLRNLRRRTVKSLDAQEGPDQVPEPRSGNPTPEQALGQEQLNQRLYAEIKRLPVDMRKVLILRDVENMSTIEAAAQLGISEPALKSRLTRARAMLKQRMARHIPRVTLLA